MTASSKAKARAVRENGKKGGRPRIERAPIADTFKFVGRFTKAQIADIADLLQNTATFADIEICGQYHYGVIIITKEPSKKYLLNGTKPQQRWNVRING